MAQKLALSTILSCLLAILILSLVLHSKSQTLKTTKAELETVRSELADLRKVHARFIETANKIEQIGRQTDAEIETIRALDSDWLDEPVDQCVYKALTGAICRISED